MYIKLIRSSAFFLMIIGFAGGQNAVTGQVTALEKILVSFGYQVTQKAIVEITPGERESNLKGKTSFALKSLKPVSGERQLYYRFTVDIEAFQNEADAQKRLERIASAPPGADSKMKRDPSFLEGFRSGNKVYLVSTDVYRFVLEKDLMRLREKLEMAVSDWVAGKRAIKIGYIPARRNEAVEASRLLEGDDFRVTLVEYPETSVNTVELIYYPSGSASEARKIADALKCCLGTVAVKESPSSPAQVGVDYFLGYLGRSPPRLTADVQTIKVAATCKAVRDAAFKYISYIVTFDVVNVIEGEYRESEVEFHVLPNADIANAILVKDIPRDSLSCDPSIQVMLMFELSSPENNTIKPPALLKGFKLPKTNN